jgi:integrase
MTAINRLTALQVKNLTKAGYHPDGGNLYLCVRPSGAKSWIFRYRHGGREREMGLGSLATFSLAEARERALQQRKLLADGIDPLCAKSVAQLQRKKTDASVITFSNAAKEYIASHRSGWKSDKHADQWTNTLETYAYPVFGRLPVSSVTTELVMRVLQPIWQNKTETASRVRGRVERVLDWCKTQGYRTGDNPAAWKGHLSNLLPPPKRTRKPEHHEALPYQEVDVFMRLLREVSSISAAALEFIILTCCRTTEAIEAKWSEIDLQLAMWTIPAARMKAKKEHVIPLSDAAMDVLLRAKASGTESVYVFPGQKVGRPLSNMACLTFLQKRMGYTHLTVHGFRSTFRDWAGETTSHPREVIEHALAHQLKDKSEASYARGTLIQKRRALMRDWATYCSGANTGSSPVPLEQA